jgi:hypothetical protein
MVGFGIIKENKVFARVKHQKLADWIWYKRK